VAQKVFTPVELEDYLADFSDGMNSGVSPLILKRSQAAFIANATVRGAFAKQRPPLQNFTLIFEDEDTQEAFETGLFQGACFFNPDSGDDGICIAISGKLYLATPNATVTTKTATVVEVSDADCEQDPDATQHWLWQAEKWIIWNDGINLPVFFDGTTCVRSRGQDPPSPPTFPNVVEQPWVVPAIGSSVTLDTASAYVGVDNIYVTILTQGVFLITGHTPTEITFQAVNPVFPGTTATTGPLGWPVIFYGELDFIPQLPVGRQGAYGMGRNVMALADGKQFVISDLVGGSSGTQANNYRDAVLAVTENALLAGGGYFTVPGAVGEIQAIRFTATLDVSLGQGPCQIFTPTTVFSVNVPVDRTIWQSLTNPILTESLISNGGVSQNATVLANGDVIFRSIGKTIRSLILARREFATWGNVPISEEMTRALDGDNTELLQYSSAAVFNDRLLMTASPSETDHGVMHQGLIALNFDPLSNLRGKLPAVYDGLWTGLNVLQLVCDKFNAPSERCFSISLNVPEDKIELYEILQDDAQLYDNNTVAIVWWFESGSLNFGQRDPRLRELLKLTDGEIYIDELEGQVDFRAYYKPDQYPCWTLWAQWSECASTDSTQVQFRPRMGLGTPDPAVCDASTNRPMREGYTFQFKLLVQGKCRFLGARFRAVTIPQQKFASVGCPCPVEPTPEIPHYRITEDGFLCLVTANGGCLYFGLTGPVGAEQFFVDEEKISKVRIQQGLLQVLNPETNTWYGVVAGEDPPQLIVISPENIVNAVPSKVRLDGDRIYLFNDTTNRFHEVGVFGVPPQITLAFVGVL